MERWEYACLRYTYDIPTDALKPSEAKSVLTFPDGRSVTRYRATCPSKGQWEESYYDGNGDKCAKPEGDFWLNLFNELGQQGWDFVNLNSVNASLPRMNGEFRYQQATPVATVTYFKRQVGG